MQSAQHRRELTGLRLLSSTPSVCESECVNVCVCVEPRPEQIHPYDDRPHTSCCLTGCLQSWAAGALWWPDVKHVKLIPDKTFLSVQQVQRSRSDTGQHWWWSVGVSLFRFFDILPHFVLQLLKCGDSLLFFGFCTVCWTENASWRHHFELCEVVTSTFYRPNK